MLRQKIFKLLAYGVPIVLICFVYFSNRSLFLDSLNLARNVAEGSFLDLAQPLKYEQSAPLLFLYLSKVCTLLFGISEYSLRLIPLISGLSCIFLCGKVIENVLDVKLALIGVFWLGTHFMIVRYATEYKQYMSDAFVTIFLIWLTLTLKELTRKNILILAIAGALSIWLSMPSVFVLCGVLGFYLHEFAKLKRPIIPIILLFVWFALNFLLEYTLILKPAIGSSHMQNFHNNYFLQGRFWNLDSLQHDFGLIISTIRMVVGKSGIAIVVALFLIGLGIYDLFRNQKSIALLLVLPILAVFGGSLLQKYSLIERLMLFTLPIFILLLLFGYNYSIKRLQQQSKLLKSSVYIVLFLAFAIGYSQTQGLKYFGQSLEREDNRTALEFINDQVEKSNPIVCTQLAYPAYSYYTHYDKNYRYLDLGNAIGAQYGESIVKMAVKQSKQEKNEVWILMGHMQEDEISNLISKLEHAGTIKNSYRTNRSAAILFFTP